MQEKSNFFEKVYEVAKLIPYGRVTSYGAIAKYLGTPKSARMVGWAMNGAHGKPDIPAHRVVNRIGVLSGKNNFVSPTLMEDLLKSEGLTILEDQIQNFKSHFWDPTEELLLD
jgi:methylated-DNA-protein-cysteine methyltransferase related protein